MKIGIRQDFSKEKSHDFEDTWSYKTIAEMHKQIRRTIYAILPDIPLNSPKFTSKNPSTKWFAQRVKSRFNHCMRTRICSPEEALEPSQPDAPPPGRRAAPGSTVWVPASAAASWRRP